MVHEYKYNMNIIQHVLKVHRWLKRNSDYKQNGMLLVIDVPLLHTAFIPLKSDNILSWILILCFRKRQHRDRVHVLTVWGGLETGEYTVRNFKTPHTCKSKTLTNSEV